MDSRGTLRALIALFVAVLFGGIAVIALFQLITSYQAKIDEAKKPEDTVMVIVAARDLYPGVVIEEEDLVAVEIPPRFLPGGVFLSPDHVVGQRPRERVLANEFIRSTRLANPESGEGLNAIIPKSMRAISVEVSGGRALSGFLSPGNYVDVLVTAEGLDDGTEPETHTLLQAVFVLAVNETGQNSTSDSSKRRTVTLLTSPEDAVRVAQAEATGRLRLALRNITDIEEVESTGFSMNDILDVVKPKEKIRTRGPRRSKPKPTVKAEAPKPPPKAGVLIIQGSSREETPAGE